MKQDNRTTTFNQPNRTTAQANRTASSKSRAASPQVNRTTTNKVGGADSPSGNTSKTTKAAMKNQPKDRLGQAVVSLIFGIFGILFFIVGMLKLGFDSQYSYIPSTSTMATIFFAFILSVVGFFLGIIARKSSKGRGMAIAGITLTTLPVVVMILIIGAGLVLIYT
ncbi:DUF4190 domain-containing protein [Paenibacillus lautus]|uniref:DUF4190 domain-containing protein n=1 Tax=Paenibacillus lautus TaxID=1401 RepID=UPI003D2E2196